MKLLTNNGKYNYMADNINISFVTLAGVDKTVMLKRTEYGRKCLISSVNDVLEYMNVINEIKVKLGGSKRIEESYFDYASFKEEWLNAVVHNLSEASDKRCYEKKNIMRSWTKKSFFYGT